MTAPLAFAQSAGYRIQPGDQLAITVLEDDTLNRQTPGAARRPHLGAARRHDRAPPDARSSRSRATIADRLASNFAVRPSVFVSVVSVDETGEHLPDLRDRPGRRPRAWSRSSRAPRSCRRSRSPAGSTASRRPSASSCAAPILDRPGAALPLQLQRRRARRRDPVDDHAARRRRDPRSRTPPLRVRAPHAPRLPRRPDAAGRRRASAAGAQQRVTFPPAPLPVTDELRPTLSFELSQSLEADTNYTCRRSGRDELLRRDPFRRRLPARHRHQPVRARDRHRRARARRAERRLRLRSRPRRARPISTTAAKASTRCSTSGLRARSRVVDSTSTLFGDIGDDGIPDPIGQTRQDAREYRYDAEHRLHRRDDLAEHLGPPGARQRLRLRRDPAKT